MSDNHSTSPAAPGKPAKPPKPYPEFPLTAHPAGYWCKKIRGKIHYFGPWNDPDGALGKYLAEKDALHAGRTPRPAPEALTVKALANAFLNHKKALLDAGELTPRTWDEYKEATDLLVRQFGKGRLVEDLGPDDFAALRNKMAKRWGPTRLGNVIQRVRSVFRYAGPDGAGLLTKHVHFGPGFARPSKKVLRLERARRGPKLFTAEEVRGLIGLPPWRPAPDAQLSAMVLLGINCGFGMADCGMMPLSAVNLDAGWVNFPRPKTGIDRRCPLWPETVAAIRAALSARPRPKKEEYAGLVFLTRQGTPWHREDGVRGPSCCKVSRALRGVGIDRKGVGFYTLRHTFRTVADATKDQVAVDHIMGHARDDMASVYRETISDERLRAVADHVHGWLFGPAPAPSSPPGATDILSPPAHGDTDVDG
jgi:integrase